MRHSNCVSHAVPGDANPRAVQGLAVPAPNGNGLGAVGPVPGNGASEFFHNVRPSALCV